jgi:hypothetical protein
MILQLLNGTWFIFFVLGIMMLTNLVNARGYFVPFYSFLEKRIKSKRLLVMLISTISGILPIPGRVIISAGALDTLAPGDSRRKHYGVINYLSTHHYYLWSPLEATVLIPISVLGLSYLQLLSITYPLLLTVLAFTLYYIFFILTENDIEIEKVEQKKEVFHPFKNIKWDVLVFVGIVIILSNFIKIYSEEITGYFMKYSSSILTGGLIAFTTSFILGSSSKFAGITTMLTVLFGIEYFPLFLSFGYSGYLISPTHKCLVITRKYFNTQSEIYQVLSILILSLVTVGYLSI